VSTLNSTFFVLTCSIVYSTLRTTQMFWVVLRVSRWMRYDLKMCLLNSFNMLYITFFLLTKLLFWFWLNFCFFL
jgi:hypothetical protein